MNRVQDRLVTASVLLSDSAWLFAVMVLVGLASGIGRSPLGLTAIMALLTVSFLTARLLQLILMPAISSYVFQMLTGAVVIYLTIGTQVPSAGQFLDLGWTAGISSIPGATLRALAGGVFGALLWWRGGRLASMDSPSETLGFSFRVGTLVLAAAAVIDVFHSDDLNIFPIMFLFFSAGLVGLGISHILPAAREGVNVTTWPRVVGGTVSAILIMGLLFSVLQRGAISLVAVPALAVMKAIGTVFFFVVIVPIAFVVFWLIQLVQSLLSTFISPEPPEVEALENLGFGETLSRLQSEANEGGWVDILLQVVQWAALAVMVLLLLFLLARAFRRAGRWRRDESEATRDTVAEDVDPAYDMAQLLFNLLPRRMRHRSRLRPLRLPDDEAGVVDVFRLYFGMLLLAENKGYRRGPSQTAGEYQRTLEEVFPANVVGAITAAFNRACYGRHPAPREQIDEMRTALDGLSAQGGQR
ncbi:MAG: DUF4129 domain-containing protein [Chloroflexi bacterium]|nr:DUF4129 domain-containing protein [Chloroflexota bacterium]